MELPVISASGVLTVHRSYKRLSANMAASGLAILHPQVGTMTSEHFRIL